MQFIPIPNAITNPNPNLIVGLPNLTRGYAIATLGYGGSTPGFAWTAARAYTALRPRSWIKRRDKWGRKNGKTGERGDMGENKYV